MWPAYSKNINLSAAVIISIKQKNRIYDYGNHMLESPLNPKSWQSGNAVPNNNCVKQSAPVETQLIKLLADALIGTTRLVEASHQSIWTCGGLFGTRTESTSGITGICYHAVRKIIAMLSSNFQYLFDGIETKRALEEVAATSDQFRRQESMLSILNGVVGDHLHSSGNGLAISMQFRFLGKSESSNDIFKRLDRSRRVVVLVHGSCMNDIQWSYNGYNYGIGLLEDLGITPIYLLYNTGLHISENGKQLSALLETLVTALPRNTQINFVAHSMGGLVTRSACHYAPQLNHQWHNHLKSIVFLGTPHHGAPLERAGNWIDHLLQLNGYARPFARLGQIRSCGVTDLRYGNILDEHWQGRCRFEKHSDDRQPVPLPNNVACYAIAAQLKTPFSSLDQGIVGDGLVSLKSAFGEYRDYQTHQNTSKRHELHLDFPKEHRWIAKGISHTGLLGHPEVYTQIFHWLR